MEIRMGKSTKTERLREEMSTAVKQSKQATLDSPLDVPKKESAKAVESRQKRQIVLTEIAGLAKEDELALRVGFRLLPSRNAFSKVTADLYFDGQKLDCLRISILASPLVLTDDFELTPVLDMKGISAGSHIIKVEMYVPWSGEKLVCASKEVVVDYAPRSREDKLIKVPIVKSIAGTDLAIVTDSQKNIYREIEENRKKDLFNKRDEW
jgi:hypothetical protein